MARRKKTLTTFDKVLKWAETHKKLVTSLAIVFTLIGVGSAVSGDEAPKKKFCHFDSVRGMFFMEGDNKIFYRHQEMYLYKRIGDEFEVWMKDGSVHYHKSDTRCAYRAIFPRADRM